ncbi:MAG: FecR domain-containing protein [Burkholderiales bacterium]|nr:FecR domain-containing protein [Burkholderiales bacterium]
MTATLPLLLAGTLAAGVSYAQDAGRVLASVGDVSVVRDNQKLPVQPGMAVRAGDTLQLGAQSNAQVRFSDESIVALRSETTFSIADYQFRAAEPDTGRAFFNLLKGGMRTITGLIGRRNQDSYGVRTSTATIGIRGTHYTLVECVQSCRNADGTLAPDGTYGTVTDGRIGATNQSGERVFGVNEVFHVAGPAALPQPLLAPPGFLRDVLEGRARAAGAAVAQQEQAKPAPKAQPSTAAVAATASVAPVLAPTGAGASSADPLLSSGVTSTTVSTLAPALTVNTFQPNNEFATVGPATVIEPTFGGTIYYRLQGPFNIPVTCTNPPCAPIVAGRIGLSINFALQRAVVSTALLAADGEMFNLGTPLNTTGFPLSVEGGQVSFSGVLNRSDPLFAEQTGSFRCSNCSAANSIGLVDQISVRGKVGADSATLELSATDAGGSGSIVVTIPKAQPPHASGAAMVIQTCTANCSSATPTLAGATAASNSQFDVTLDASGRLVQYGTQNAGGTGPATAYPGTVGRLTGFVGSAQNVIIGSDASAGNLVWGRWVGPGARLTDGNYVAYTTAANQRQPWITGDLPNTVPPSLGSQTYTLISTPSGFAAAFSSNTSRVNSATLNADFVNRFMTLSVNVTNAASPTNTNTYQASGSSGISPITGRFSAGFSSTTCTGACNNGVSRPDGSFSGFFSGAQAQGAAVALTVGFGASASPTTGAGVSGVIGLKR